MLLHIKEIKMRLVLVTSFLFGLFLGIAYSDIRGQVVDENGLAMGGVVIYDITDTTLEIINNETTLIEHLSRTITDKDGQFILKRESDGTILLIARDIQDRFAIYSSSDIPSNPITITIQCSAKLKGLLLTGPKPMENTEITLVFAMYQEHLRYFLKTKTNQNGVFQFNNLLPGPYSLLVLQDIPAIGCTGNIITQHKKIELKSGDVQEIQIGGSDFPYLTGTVSSHLGAPLHGVWVELFSCEPDPNSETHIWADVTDPNGLYSIYDLPAGQYYVRCLRRLAKNTPSRVMKKNLSIEIKEPFMVVGKGKKNFGEKQNTLNIKIDPEPFMPLQIGQDAPELQTKTIKGENWTLNQNKGKVIIIHFYKTTSRFCMANFDSFENVQTTFNPYVEVIGISLDKSKVDCENLMKEKSPTHRQIYEGPNSQTAKDYRVTDVPSCFVIDREGKIAQIDLFGATLKKYIQEKLLK